jgi:thymidine kinase
MIKTINNTGYLELIVGPMFCGKTSLLLSIYKQLIFCDIPVTIINHSIDTRYHESMVSTHDKIMAPCIQTTHLSNLWFEQNTDSNSDNYTKVKNSDVILINEGQFFDDLYIVVDDMLKNNKRVYVCGLDSDFERKKFGQILDLIPICDKIVKLTSLCSKCKDGTPAIFSMRLTQEKQQTLVGSDNYIPVCRKCFVR